MENGTPLWKIVAIMLAIVLPVVIFFQTRLGKIIIMTHSDFSKKLVAYIQKWEGGLSRDPKDTASKNPAPWTHNGLTGWHTNKGVTYETFSSLATSLGYAPTAQNFFTMPDDIWYKILWNGYAKPFQLERINHLPRIQAVIISWAWGSGVGGATTRLARFQREVMGIQDGNITTLEIVGYFNQLVTAKNEIEVFNKLCDRRLQDFQKMPSWNAHGKGWTNRLNDFRKTFGS